MIPPEAWRHPHHHCRDAIAEELLQLLPGTCEIRRALVCQSPDGDGEALSERHEQALDDASA